MITKDQAIQIALQQARLNKTGLFETPFVISVVPHVQTGNWVVELNSLDPSREQDGGMYMFVTIDKCSGSVLEVDTGGGS